MIHLDNIGPAFLYQGPFWRTAFWVSYAGWAIIELGIWSRDRTRVKGERTALRTVVADGFDRAAFFGFLAARFLLGIFGLLVNKRVTAVVTAFEIVRGGFAAQITVDALLIDVKLALDVLRPLVCFVGHR